VDEVQISHNVVLDKMGRINGGIEDIETDFSDWTHWSETVSTENIVDEFVSPPRILHKGLANFFALRSYVL
jgi:hypothetical protein